MFLADNGKKGRFSRFFPTTFFLFLKEPRFLKTSICAENLRFSPFPDTILGDWTQQKREDTEILSSLDLCDALGVRACFHVRPHTRNSDPSLIHHIKIRIIFVEHITSRL